uniref:Secreted protein n=1 Tax=Arundo donax TaxID=35708 RepID=A0A0A9CLL8_ARUDO
MKPLLRIGQPKTSIFLTVFTLVICLVMCSCNPQHYVTMMTEIGSAFFFYLEVATERSSGKQLCLLLIQVEACKESLLRM